jgi:hypothetical protein
MLLTLDEFRGLRETGLDDEPLQLLLDAAEAEITRHAGPVGEVTQLHTHGGRLLALGRAAASVSSITETSFSTHEVTTLAADDYYIWPGGYIIERQSGGTNSRHTWFDRTTTVYVPADDVDIRKGVQADLVNLMLNYQPGLTSETVGSWTTQLAANSVWNNSDERIAILSRLSTGGRMAIAS